MKKHIVTIMALMALVSVGAGAQAPEAQEVKSMLRLVADWERANHLIDEGEHGDLAWTQAALYVGMLDWAEVAEREDGDDSYFQWIRRIGRRNSWQTGKMMYHADDIAVSQAWLTMYAKYRERNMLLPTLARTEFVLRYRSLCSGILRAALSNWTIRMRRLSSAGPGATRFSWLLRCMRGCMS